MLIKIPRGWEVPEREATPEEQYRTRRNLLQSMGFVGVGGTLTRLLHAATGQGNLYPAKRNTKYTLDRPLTMEHVATGYNNFYEFTLDKQQVRFRSTSSKSILGRSRSTDGSTILGSTISTISSGSSRLKSGSTGFGVSRLGRWLFLGPDFQCRR